MPDLLIYGLIFVASLATLVKASDFFTDASEKIGILMGLSPFMVGMTIVAIGTSLPELISSILAVLENSSEIVIGNVIGSNIVNIFLVIGTAAAMNLGRTKEIKISYDLVSVDLPLFIGSTFLLALTVWDQKFSLVESLLFLVGYVMYLFYTLQTSESVEDELDGKEITTEVEKNFSSITKESLIVITSSALMFLGAYYTIDSLIEISEILNIGKEIIALSAVALGTYLQELIVTISARLKGKADVAVGNVLGSNIFNIFVVMGVPRLMGELTIPKSVVVESLPTLIAGTLLLFFATQDKKLTIWEGWLFLLFYFWFICKTFNIA